MLWRRYGGRSQALDLLAILEFSVGTARPAMSDKKLARSKALHRRARHAGDRWHTFHRRFRERGRLSTGDRNHQSIRADQVLRRHNPRRRPCAAPARQSRAPTRASASRRRHLAARGAGRNTDRYAPWAARKSPTGAVVHQPDREPVCGELLIFPESAIRHTQAREFESPCSTSPRCRAFSAEVREIRACARVRRNKHRTARPAARTVNKCWSVDFVSDALFDGREGRAGPLLRGKRL